MNKAKKRLAEVLRLIFVVGLLVTLAVCVVPVVAVAASASDGAQESGQNQSQQPDQNQKPPDKTAPDNSTPTSTTPPKEETPKEEKEETKITPRQAEELFHSVDDILAFDSKQSGLAVKHEVKRKLTSREEVVRYLTKNKDDKDTQRLRRSELVLKKFGLLPREFDLEKLLVDLLREQVAGYYDPKTKTVHLLDWVPLEEQEPVMAHELTHALQDQAVNLNKWMGRGEKDLGEIRKNPTSADIENDEVDDARQAVVEGQAEAVMLQYALAPVGRSIVDSPDLVDEMESNMTDGTSDSTVFRDAPIFLKESLTFPYRYGLEFEIKLLKKGGKEKAFAAVLANPPHTTRQIMEPDTYLSAEKIEPMPVPNFKEDFPNPSWWVRLFHPKRVGKNYQKFDVGAMGEFDVAILVEQYAGEQVAKQLYPAWRGGYYYAARVKDDASAPLGLLYVSRWSSAEKAADFGMIYSQSLAKRYKRVVVTQDPDLSESSGSQIVDQEESGLHGKHIFQTEEGAVIIEEKGDTVFVSESLDTATTERLEREVFGK